MWEWLERIFGQGFMPHGHCYLWSPAMVWTQVSSNLLIGVAYASIATTLALLVRRIQSIPFAWVYLAFGTFILSCGLTHWIDIITVWHPIYWVDAGVRVLTATASVATAALIVPMVPKAVALANEARSSGERGRQLAAAHTQLEQAHAQLAEREREAQRRARTSEEQVRSFVETMPQLAWISDANGKHLFRNQRWHEYTGISTQDPNDPAWNVVHDPETVERVLARWHVALANKEPYEVEARFRRADGEFRWFLVRAVPLNDDAGQIASWVGTCTDIHDQKLLHEEALRTAKMKDEFLATVSHELRTPLNAILGWSHLLRADALEPDKRERALESVQRNAMAQARLVEDLLDVSRIISGKMHLDARLINPADAIEGALDALRPAALAKGVELSTAIDRAAGLVLADSSRIQQIVWNLLGNAVKFTPAQGRVQLRFARVGARLELVVADTGAGIKPEFLPHLFERFSQEDGSIRRAHGGLGLGLAITKHLVEAHGGTIRAESAGEDRGATFVVTLPLSATQTPDARPPTEQTAKSGLEYAELNGIRLLLVEDDVDSRDVVAAILNESGVEVTTASDAEKAIELLRSNPVDVIVSDVGLPGLDGYAFMRAIRQDPALSGIPAAALTAYAHTEDRRRALDAGFQMHLTKPFDQRELFAVIADLAKIAAALKARTE